MPAMDTLDDLRRRHHQAGRLLWIGLRSSKRGAIDTPDSARMDEATGLIGDHWAGKRSTKRQITLIQAEHLPVIAVLSGHEQVRPAQLRRNLLIGDINIYTLREQRFQLGEVVLEGTGLAAPCSRMEAELGHGGYNAMRGHGGITARVIRGGAIRIGDALVPLDDPA